MIAPSLRLTQALKSVLITNYCNFNGRARRSEYWMFVLFNVLVLLFFSFLLSLCNSDKSAAENIASIYSIYFLFAIIPSISVVIRRLHDTGKSGILIFLSIIPVIGILMLIYFLCEDSHPSLNIYGNSPKYNHELMNQVIQSPIIVDNRKVTTPPQTNLVSPPQINIVSNVNVVIPSQVNVVAPPQQNVIVPPQQNMNYTPQQNLNYDFPTANEVYPPPGTAYNPQDNEMYPPPGTIYNPQGNEMYPPPGNPMNAPYP